MSIIREEQDEFIQEFNEIGDWLFQYECLLEMSASIEGISEDEKNDGNLVSGCLSKVWLICKSKDGKVFLRADSEALIIKGIVGVIVQLFHGRSHREIIEAEIDFIDKTPIKQEISTDRFNGMSSVIKIIKQFAIDHENATE